MTPSGMTHTLKGKWGTMIGNGVKQVGRGRQDKAFHNVQGNLKHLI